MTDREYIERILEKQARKAERDGFTVDRSCWPWVAYQGPRFAPTKWIWIPS